MPTNKRPHTDATVPHIPADVRDIMSALVRTPPPSSAGDKSTRKQVEGAKETARQRAQQSKELIEDTKEVVKASRALLKRAKRKGR